MMLNERVFSDFADNAGNTTKFRAANLAAKERSTLWQVQLNVRP
jgi:hypothetical protein